MGDLGTGLALGIPLGMLAGAFLITYVEPRISWWPRQPSAHREVEQHLARGGYPSGTPTGPPPKPPTSAGPGVRSHHPRCDDHNSHTGPCSRAGYSLPIYTDTPKPAHPPAGPGGVSGEPLPTVHPGALEPHRCVYGGYPAACIRCGRPLGHRQDCPGDHDGACPTPADPHAPAGDRTAPWTPEGPGTPTASIPTAATTPTPTPGDPHEHCHPGHCIPYTDHRATDPCPAATVHPHSHPWSEPCTEACPMHRQ